MPVGGISCSRDPIALTDPDYIEFISLSSFTYSKFPVQKPAPIGGWGGSDLCSKVSGQADVYSCLFKLPRYTRNANEDKESPSFRTCLFHYSSSDSSESPPSVSINLSCLITCWCGNPVLNGSHRQSHSPTWVLVASAETGVSW